MKQTALKSMMGTYKLHSDRGKVFNYQLTISEGQYTKVLENGQTVQCKIEWRECILILKDSIEAKAQLGKQIVDGLGELGFEFTRSKGKTINYRLVRTANLNVVADEGKLVRVKH